jgi:hypothetical protein
MLDAASRFDGAPDDQTMKRLVARVQPQPIFV